MAINEHRVHLKPRYGGVAGVYEPNHFLITLDSSAPYLFVNTQEKLGINEQYLPVFGHEYWHFWHNISTVSGFKAFAFTQHLLMLFGGTVIDDADGSSRGGVMLSTAEEKRATALAELQRDHDGDAGPGSVEGKPVKNFEVTGVIEHDETKPLGTKDIPNPKVRINVDVQLKDDTYVRGQSFTFGAFAIEESIAHYVQRSINKAFGSGITFITTEFPYRVLDRLFGFLVGPDVSSGFVPAALGTLALLFTHPGAALVTLMKHYAKARLIGLSDDQALAKVTDIGKKSIVKTIASVFDNDLHELERMHQGHGLAEGAMRIIGEWYRTNLSRRSVDPLFDMRQFSPSLDKTAFKNFLEEHPSCDLLQERAPNPADDTEPRDLLISFLSDTVDSFGFRLSDYLRMFQAQQHYMLSHLSTDELVFLPSAQRAVSCPFYYACPLPIRKGMIARCGNEPWMTYGSPDGLCWYGIAVASTIGKVRIRLAVKG